MIYVDELRDHICGYSLDIKYNKNDNHGISLVFQKRKNAEMVKRIIEADNAGKDAEAECGYWYKINKFPRHHFCSKCGKGNRTKSDFCPNCGDKKDASKIRTQTMWLIHYSDDDFQHHYCPSCGEDAIFEYIYETVWDENYDGEMVECGETCTGIHEHLTAFCPQCGTKLK